MRLPRLRTPIVVGALSVLLMLGGPASRSDSPPAARVSSAAPVAHRDILHTFMPPRDPVVARRRSLDLYLPAVTGETPPLVAFVHSGFWIEPDEPLRHRGPALAQAQALVPVAPNKLFFNSL